MKKAQAAQAELQALRAEMERLKRGNETNTLHAGIVASAMDAILVIDESQSIVQFNAAAEQVFGYSAEQVLGKNLAMLLPEKFRERHAHHVQKFAEDGVTVRSRNLLGKLSGQRASGEVFPLEISISQTVVNGRNFQAAILRDVSEREQLEKLILRQYDSLNTLHLITLGLLNRRNVTDLLQFIVNEAEKLLDVSFCEILLPEEEMLVAQAFTRHQPFQAGNRFSRREARLSWQVLETGKPVVLEDYSTWANRHEIYAGEEFHAAAALPLLANGQCLGVLGITRDAPGYPFTDEQILVATRLADIAALAIENSRLYQEVKRLATMDELTGIHNRRSLTQMGGREVQRAARYGRPLSVMMVDVDHFKHINDTWGHAAGDIVLRGVAQEILRQIRILDMLGRYGRLGGDTENILGRYGGEEFGLLFPETSLKGALVVAERIRTAIQGMSFVVPGVDEAGRESTATLRITASIGVASMESPEETLPDLFSLADQALYQAKETGRNRVCAVATRDMVEANYRLDIAQV